MTLVQYTINQTRPAVKSRMLVLCLIIKSVYYLPGCLIPRVTIHFSLIKSVLFGGGASLAYLQAEGGHRGWQEPRAASCGGSSVGAVWLLSGLMTFNGCKKAP